MFKKHNLFSSPVYVTTIDPTSYKKDEFIKAVESNYNKSPYRNKWDNDESDIHHIYDDYDNPLFEKYDFEGMFKSLKDQYANIAKEYVMQMHFDKTVSYGWTIVNVTGMKEAQFMMPHAHMEFDGEKTTIASAVHYLRYKEGHLSTMFQTPLAVMYDLYTYKTYRKVLDVTYPENSSYFTDYYLDVKEDEIHIFPSYLKHYVPRQKSDELRITVVVNIDVWETKVI
jgi:hypothetical protein